MTLGVALVPWLLESGEDGGNGDSLKRVFLIALTVKSPLCIVLNMKDAAMVQRLTFISSSARSQRVWAFFKISEKYKERGQILFSVTLVLMGRNLMEVCRSF